MEKKYEFKGSTYGKSYIILKDDTLTIVRKGIMSLIYQGMKGEKTIQISSITGTQYKKYGIMNGYLQFVIMGSQENKGGLNASKYDENTVCWANKKGNQYAEEIIKYINEYNSGIHTSNNIPQEDQYDKIEKIKKLLDEGALTQREFEEQKKKILNK